MNLETNLHHAKQGDRKAFVALMKHMESDMYGMARSILRSNEDCADAMQEAMLKAYQSLGELREPRYFKTWLLRILINECRLIIRKQKRIVPVAEFIKEPSTSGGYEQIELREAIDHLEESMRTVISLHYLRDMPIREISEVLDVSEGAVKTRLHRARRTLMDLLQNRGERKVTLQ
ncbi:sigma-70 family RNA polymerase sigma factor [Paenibacillus polymyxa]|uniref:Sigma-70 family RNA polymerase sigma factor n=1 Tax=Paenibacillus polymyxa TaxID=1406 RepID=A0A8I1J792_PAEPO|nr:MULTISPECIES: sigma-70 family RNA polymerase sigma factor [Paenibacillus]KAF6573743.1 sigma-70 family RNA polymerase sigma factor [Paenibacillus sp. EKM206P]KAF6588372.1 sigma-70 family RNA polymerase sigma factor [Paenibacillus sp. EKM205P]MBM0634746.1 sigma-70 family RNA polymerase sigma factor [Paenibacillus polymyxa]